MNETKIMLHGFALGGGVLLAIKSVLALLIFLTLTLYPVGPTHVAWAHSRPHSHNVRHVGASHWHPHR